MKHGLKLYVKNRLVARFIDDEGNIYSQGLRVGANCLMTLEERRVYVKHGAVKVIKYIRDTRGITLSKAYELFQASRDYKLRR